METYFLATDLDGTLIPLEQGKEEHQRSLELLKKRMAGDEAHPIVFVTGRHMESVCRVMQSEGLPTPKWMVTDVGSRIYLLEGEDWVPMKAYDEHLNSIVDYIGREQVEKALSNLEFMRLQESAHQGPYKISYYFESVGLKEAMDTVRTELVKYKLPYSMVASIDPFSGVGLMDILPLEVNKRHALEWLEEHQSSPSDRWVFAGDSGNDLDVILSDIPSVLVANAPAEVRKQAEQYAEQYPQSIYLSEGASTTGVVEGCRHFGWL